MATKKQQTFAKMQREQRVREKRQLKAEKKQAAAEAKLAAATAPALEPDTEIEGIEEAEDVQQEELHA